MVWIIGAHICPTLQFKSVPHDKTTEEKGDLIESERETRASVVRACVFVCSVQNKWFLYSFAQFQW